MFFGCRQRVCACTLSHAPIFCLPILFCAVLSNSKSVQCSKCDAYSKLDTTNGWFDPIRGAFVDEPFCDGLCMRNTQYGALTEVRLLSTI
jgi:hypothetical protein